MRYPNPPRDAAIVRGYRRGQTMDALKEAYDLGYARIWQILRAGGVKFKRRGTPTNWSPKKHLPRAKRLYRGGLAFGEVARELDIGVSAETIRQAFLRAGVPIRERGEAIRLHWERR